MLAIRRIEQGQVKWKLPYIRVLLEEYGVGGQDARTFLALATQANQPGWWYRYRDVLPDWFRAFVSLEEEASLMRAYEPHYIPGLMQTEDYARTVLLPNVKLQVIPFGLYVHEAMYGPFHIFRFPFPELQDIVYVETVLGAFSSVPFARRSKDEPHTQREP